MDRVRRQGCAHTAWAQRHVVNRGVLGKHGDDDFAILADFRNGCRNPGAGGPEFRGRLGYYVKDRQVVSRAQDPTRHSFTHAAQTDESDFHMYFTPAVGAVSHRAYSLFQPACASLLLRDDGPILVAIAVCDGRQQPVADRVATRQWHAC